MEALLEMAVATLTPIQRATVVRTRLTGPELINDPRLNKGTAFTEQERDMFSLHGILPPHIGTLDEQVARRLQRFRAQPTPFAKYAFMRDMQDASEIIFYALILRNLKEMLPIVYTPTVGEGCQRFSEIWHHPRGFFVSYGNRHRIDQILSSPRYDSVKCIVVSDGERILGLGDQGIGGMGIPIGKTALYTVLAGIPPESCLPILLDAGTDNEDRLRDPLYVGCAHKRIRGEQYDEFVDAFISAVKRRWPHVLLQWEDFACCNAARLLNRYRDELCSFNDDIQGTGAVVGATLLSALGVTGSSLSEQRIVIVGLGSAGLGIANQLAALMRDEALSETEARRRFYAIDRDGLLVEGIGGIRTDQSGFTRSRSDVADWNLCHSPIGLTEVIRNVCPTVLIGACGQPGTFSEEAVREMAAHVDRPIILPLSNPTTRCEATPEDLLAWTNGRALIGTGSPFEPVPFDGKRISIAQTNNSYIFPGLALGVISSRAVRISDAMIRTAARTLANLSPARKDKSASLLPPIEAIRSVSLQIASAVAQQAVREGLAKVDLETLGGELVANIWEPVYHPYELVRD